MRRNLIKEVSYKACTGWFHNEKMRGKGEEVEIE